MFVCMFYLSPRSRIIVSIWETSELQRENKRSKREREKEEAEVQSLRYKHCALCIVCNFAEILLLFFVFIFYIIAKGLLRGLSSKLLSLLFLFFFFLFFFFGTQTSLSISETCDGSDLSYSLFCPVNIAKKHVARQGRFVYSVTWTFFVVFELEFRLVFFELPCWRSQK